MKAIICTKSGPPDVLQLRKVEKPTLKDSELLIRIYAKTCHVGRIRSFKIEGL
jgi:NADPH:quinone reductase-like Zn-dependent oxidoreductase